MHGHTVHREITKAIYGNHNWTGISGPLNGQVLEKSGLVAMTLSDFISKFSGELGDYYDEDFGTDETENRSFGDTFVFVLVDLGSDHLPQKIKKKIRKAGKWRRDKLKHQWSYVNPMNRIHGFLIMQNVTNENHKQLTLSINAIGSSYFSEKKGIGKDLIEIAKKFATNMGAHDIVLEVANEYSGECFPEESDEESEESEESDEESDDSDEESDEESEWFPDESTLDILSSELWKKCMRKNDRGIPYYNLEQAYIGEGLDNYFQSLTNSPDASSLWTGTHKNIIEDKDDPGDHEYGGVWYQKGKRSQKRLMGFYEKLGFKEDIRVHTDWCCFGQIPYPSMRYICPYTY